MRYQWISLFLLFVYFATPLNAERLRIKSVVLTDAQLGADVEDIDTVRNPDCDEDTTTLEPEPFGTIRFRLSVQSDYLETVQIERYQVRVSGLYRSRRYPPSTVSDIPARSSNDAVEGYLALTSGVSKRFIGDSVDIPAASVVRRITIILYGRRASGQRVIARARIARAFGDIDNC